jgi:PAS domain S-box-containing protein
MAGSSFIDVAVREPMRSRFAAGDALILLDESLDTAIWANGAGAELLGHDTVEAAIGAETDFSAAARRQIMATPGFPSIGENRTVIVRIGQAPSRAVLFRASGVDLGDGTMAILLAAPLADASRAAQQIVAGLSGPGEEAACLDANGAILASTPGFSTIAPEPADLTRLTAEASGEHDRLVKRIIEGRTGRVGAGLARLSDAPARYLLILVADTAEEPDSAEEPAKDEKPEASAEAAAPVIATEDASNGTVDGWYFSGTRADSTPNASAVPVRFAWRTDADGRFNAVSAEFSEAVGKPAADIIGRTFDEVSRVFDLDPGGEIGTLLERRDTWSGRTVMWPISGTDLKVPVDLAALPAYSRDRTFDGFRGFGIARLADAVVDPEAIGLSLVASEAAPPPVAEEDPFAGETPALVVAPEPELPSGKVVRLAERRPVAAERELSQTEQQAFREIGNRLKQDREQPRAQETVLSFDAGSAADIVSESAAEPVQEPETETEDRFPVAGAEAGDHETSVDSPMAADVEESAEPGAPLPEMVEATDTSPRDEEMPVAATIAVQAAPAVAASPALLARLPLPMLVHSGDRLHYANAEFLERTGYASLADLVDAGGLGALIAGPYPADDDSPAQRRAVRIVTRSGDEQPVEAHLQTIPWAQGRALLLSLRPAPVTVETHEPPAPALAPAPIIALHAEREPPVEPTVGTAPVDHESDPAARKRIGELEAILDTATDGIVTLDQEGMIRSVSKAAEALFGFDASDLAGKPFTALFASESQRAARDYLAGLTENGVASVLNDGREVIGLEAKGGFIPLFMTIGRLPGDSGFCAVLRDITQFKRAEEELTQARRKAEAASTQKSDFLARVSHEIRTPLNAIIGFSELMLDEKFGPVGSERYRDYLRDINKSGNHVLDLVNDLLDISKIEAGQQDLSYEAVRLNETLSDAVSLMQPQANRARVIIRSSFAASLPEVVADLRSIKQIALNLLSNAVRYTNAGGQVIVSTAYEPNGDVALRVRDTGVGMTRAEIEQALKPFKQISTLKRARGDGTGLGLPLTKALVEANRARFVINSTPGEGTMVEIVFPSTRVLAG